MYACRVEESLDAVPARLWDGLVPDRAFHASHAWLCSVDEAAQGRFRAAYVLALDPTGAIVAALPCYLVENPRHYDLYNPFDVLGPPAATPGPGGGLPPAGRDAFFPALLCGSVSGYDSAVLVDGTLSDGERLLALRLLVGEAEQLARRHGARTVAFPYVAPSQVERLRGALSEDYGERLVAARCRLGLDVGDFDDYVARLGGSRRRAVRRELSRFESSGLRARVCPLSDCAPGLPPLLANVQRKYGHETNLARMARTMSIYVRRLDPLSRVFLAELQGQPVGFALFFAWRGRYNARVVGFDYARLGGTDCYFNLLFYLPVQEALREGIADVDYGVEGFEAKVSRGCDLHPLLWLVKPPEEWRDALRADQEARSCAVGRSFAHLAAKFGRTWSGPA